MEKLAGKHEVVLPSRQYDHRLSTHRLTTRMLPEDQRDEYGNTWTPVTPAHASQVRYRLDAFNRQFILELELHTNLFHPQFHHAKYNDDDGMLVSCWWSTLA